MERLHSAKLVCNDERVKSYFDQRNVGFCFRKIQYGGQIMKAIIASAKEQVCDLENMDPLQSRLRRTLHGKKYLLLDDVWNENQEEWLQLKTLLMAGSRGSKIIATARSEVVGSVMGTFPTYHLE